MPNVRVHNKTSIIKDEKYSMHTLQPHALTQPLHAWFRCMLNIILCIEHGVLYVFWQAKYIQVLCKFNLHADKTCNSCVCGNTSHHVNLLLQSFRFVNPDLHHMPHTVLLALIPPCIDI
jgi:hypothetical protein